MRALVCREFRADSCIQVGRSCQRKRESLIVAEDCGSAEGVVVVIIVMCNNVCLYKYGEHIIIKTIKITVDFYSKF